jgi:hypothetical protein
MVSSFLCFNFARLQPRPMSPSVKARTPALESSLSHCCKPETRCGGFEVRGMSSLVRMPPLNVPSSRGTSWKKCFLLGAHSFDRPEVKVRESRGTETRAGKRDLRESGIVLV